MLTLMTDPRELLTSEQQELYDGVLIECHQNHETALAVLDRYARLVQEQNRDVAAVRAVLSNSGIAKVAPASEETR